jgi:hypothetical protein
MSLPTIEYVAWHLSFTKGLECGLSQSESVQYADSTVNLFYGPNPTSPAQELGKCHYCEQNNAEGEKVVNPHTGLSVPSCSVCEYFIRLESDRLNKTRITGLIGWLAIVGGIACAIAVNIAYGIVLAFTGALILIACDKIWSRDERDAKVLVFAQHRHLFWHQLLEPTRIRWCKNCIHFQYRDDWEEAANGQWQREIRTPDSLLPCCNPKESNDAWTSFFNTPKNARFCYPKDCNSFLPKIDRNL